MKMMFWPNNYSFRKSHKVTSPYSSPFFVIITQSLDDSKNGLTLVAEVKHEMMGGDSSINSETLILESLSLEIFLIFEIEKN